MLLAAPTCRVHRNKIGCIVLFRPGMLLHSANDRSIPLNRLWNFFVDMGRPRSGSIWTSSDGQIFARITYNDETGRRRDIKRKAISRTHARQIIKDMLREIEERGEQSLDSSRVTFAQLAKHYKDRYVKPARYVENRKVSGLRSHGEVARIVTILEDHFDVKRLRSITHGDILNFKAERIDTPVAPRATKQGKKKPKPRQRSIATVNRELTVLKRMFSIAQREGWILRHPFAGSDTIISSSDETKRTRVLSREEEELLLDACDENRSRLKPIIVMALDTGMRRGEIFSLRWRDVDLSNRRINIQAMNTKTLRSRSVPISSRLLVELDALPRRSESARVFGITDTIKRSWGTAKRVAGIQDLRFHDLRHTCATRLVQGGLPIAEVSRILGHTSIVTTFRYANVDDSTLDRAVAILERR
jgi:integrase